MVQMYHMRKTLTKAQTRVLDFLRSYAQEMGYPPSIREIKDGLGLASHSSLQNCLSALEKNGYIRRSSRARAIEFCEFLRPGQMVTLPLIGHIKAGAPHPAIEDVEGYIAVDKSFTVGDRKSTRLNSSHSQI